MFVPDIFQFESETDKITFMKQYNFATIITIKDNIPIATQLPFIIDQRDGKLILNSHFAAANEQTKYIEANTSLVVFSEPHAYISPSLYDHEQGTPTWDYISIHAYGKAKILTDEDSKIKVLEQMIKFY